MTSLHGGCVSLHFDFILRRDHFCSRFRFREHDSAEQCWAVDAEAARFAYLIVLAHGEPCA